MANEANRFSQIIDLLWDKDVPTDKKVAGSDLMVKHLMGVNFTQAAFDALSNDQKADAIMTAMRQALLKMVQAGGQADTAKTLEQEIIDGGNVAVSSFDPDLP